MVDALQKNPAWQGRRGPLLLVIMDGIGYGVHVEGDAVAAAVTGSLDKLRADCPHTRLKAHGKAVGLPADDDMGNSEVGHNAIGCGRVFAQGSKLVGASIAAGAMFQGKTWRDLMASLVPSGKCLHFLGLFSDGNVHSHIDHLKAMIDRAAAEGIKRLRVHVLLDGRDVGEQSALEFIDPFEDWLAGFKAHCKYAEVFYKW